MPHQEATGHAALFARVSEDIMSEPAEEATLQRVVDWCVETVPACEHASLSLRGPRGQEYNGASSSAVADRCDKLQYELDEGPCVQAIRDEDSYLIRNTKRDDRWPEWRGRVAAEGIGSVLSINLTSGDATFGALNLYATGIDAFSEDDIDLALIFASHASTAMSAARQLSGMQTAMSSRHIIGVAQGILMARHGIDMNQAFDLLRRISSTTNLKLRDLAEQVVAGRGLDGINRTPHGPRSRNGRPTG